MKVGRWLDSPTERKSHRVRTIPGTCHTAVVENIDDISYFVLIKNDPYILNKICMLVHSIRAVRYHTGPYGINHSRVLLLLLLHFVLSAVPTLHAYR